MGTVVVGVIDGFNGLLEKTDAEALHVQQHIGLVLKALALNVAEGPEIPGRDGTQARLRVGQPDAEQDFEKARGGFVARHRARRNTGQTEIPAAEHHLVCVFQHALPAGDDVLCQMLSVAVDGDDAAQRGKLFPHIAESGLERAAFAFVDLVRQHCAAGHRSGLVEEVPPLVFASVVDDDKVLKAFLKKAFNDVYKLLVRVEGRQNDRHARPAIQVL